MTDSAIPVPVDYAQEALDRARGGRPRMAPRPKPEQVAKVRHVTGAGARIGGDHIALWWIEVFGTVGIALAAFATSVTSLLSVASWQHTPEVLHFLTPVMIDLPIAVFATMTITFKHREQRAPMWFARMLSFTLTAFSSVANFLHTVDVSGGIRGYEDAVGACFNAAAPWIVLACTELLGHLITRPKAERGKAQRQADEIKTLKAQLRTANRAASKAVES
jgi:hypothetical protein